MKKEPETPEFKAFRLFNWGKLMRPFIKHLIERGCITVSFDGKIIHFADVLRKNSIGAAPIVDKTKNWWV